MSTNTVEKMDLDDWRAQVGSHLQFIEHGASMAARRARMLPGKPEWETRAEDELAKARVVLETALANVIAAQAIYADKPILEQSHAA